MIAKPVNKTVTPYWPDPHILMWMCEMMKPRGWNMPFKGTRTWHGGGQGWGQTHFIRYKYFFFRVWNTNTITKILNTNAAHQIQIEAETKLMPCNLFYYEKIVLFIQISVNLVFKGPINNKPALIQIMAWCWLGTNHWMAQSVYWCKNVSLDPNEQMPNSLDLDG